ncbi:MAG: leucine-rich repeat domain-containing protein, partial [Clostridiales bacterium]|nr:leucine-rich repeat domain-containing protein [Clostridiales bacterium]
MLKKLLTILLCLSLSLSYISISPNTGVEFFRPEITYAAEDASGTCGTSLTWTFVASTGRLTISGTGAMTNYIYSDSTPWYSFNSSITKLTLNSGMTSISNNAFVNCSNITGTLTIPSGVTSIGSFAFANCSGFTGSLTIPSGVTSIGSSAFQECEGFASLTIPSSVTSIGSYAFAGCIGLKGSLTIPSGITSISEATFMGCEGFTGALTIPSSVKSIGEFAFGACDGLASITVPDSVTSITGQFVFTVSSSSALVINCHYGSAADTFIKKYNSKRCNNLYDATISGVSSKTHTGSAITQPSLVLTAKTYANPSGVAITKDTDYTVSYSNNTNVGTATVTVTGTGNYSGTLSRTFSITAAPSPSPTVGTPGNISYSSLQWGSTLTAPSNPTGGTRTRWEYA